MNEKLILEIDKEIEEYTSAIAADTVKLVKIKSVKDAPLPGAPFGKGAKAVLDTFTEMAKAEGLYTKDYNVGVISAAMKDGEPDLGIWLHGDVVPEGDGWNFEPYGATEYEGCIIGRGATDNKGQLAAVFNLFKIFKKLNVELKYNPAIYLGSNEETGMCDIAGMDGNPDAKGFINVCTPPRLSLVPDGSFPVGYGGKGGMNIAVKSKTRLESLAYIIAGEDASPGLAKAQLKPEISVPDEMEGYTVIKGDSTEIRAFTPPVHTSRPDPNGNMITRLSEALLKLDGISENDRAIIEFLRKTSLDVNGEDVGIATTHELIKPLTMCAKQVRCADGYPEVTYNIRYPLGITYEAIVARITEYANSHGFELSFAKAGVKPYLLDPDNDIVNRLWNAANSITCTDKPPYTLSGGTYAHRLPNAYVFGMEGNQPPKDFPKGRGGAHGIDEAVSLARLKRAMKIYARALLSLNETKW